MRKVAKCLLVLWMLVSLGGTCAVVFFTRSVGQSLKEYRQWAVCEAISLGARLRGIGQYPSDDARGSAAPVSADPAAVPGGVQDGSGGEGQVTSASAHAGQPLEVLYRVGVFRGMIGVYDTDGVLLRTVNTAVATLPQTDRQSLEAGIFVLSDEELEALIARYE